MQNITLNTSSVQNNSNESGISDNGLYPEANSLNGSTNENLAFTNKSNTFIENQTIGGSLQVNGSTLLSSSLQVNGSTNLLSSLQVNGFTLFQNTVGLNNWISEFNGISTKGGGVPAIYGLDNRIAVTTADGSQIVLYKTTTAGVFRVSARALATAGTSATYVISWTENSVVQTQTITVSAVNTENHNTFLIQPDNDTYITAQITAITSTTLNVACVVEQLV